MHRLDHVVAGTASQSQRGRDVVQHGAGPGQGVGPFGTGDVEGVGLGLQAGALASRQCAVLLRVRQRVGMQMTLGEALHGGAIGLLRDGDLLRVDAVTGRLDCLTDLSGRTQAEIDLTLEQEGWGRELFSVMRRAVSSAECGATIFD